MPLPTILIEDSQTILEILIPALDEIADAQVMAVEGTAAAGVAAMTAYADSWRLVVVDLFLKEGSGLDVVRAGQARRDDQHILLVTNFATPEIRRRAIEAGADAVFDKSDRSSSCSSSSARRIRPSKANPRRTGCGRGSWSVWPVKPRGWKVDRTLLIDAPWSAVPMPDDPLERRKTARRCAGCVEPHPLIAGTPRVADRSWTPARGDPTFSCGSAPAH